TFSRFSIIYCCKHKQIALSLRRAGLLSSRLSRTMDEAVEIQPRYVMDEPRDTAAQHSERQAPEQSTAAGLLTSVYDNKFIVILIVVVIVIIAFVTYVIFKRPEVEPAATKYKKRSKKEATSSDSDEEISP